VASIAFLSMLLLLALLLAAMTGAQGRLLQEYPAAQPPPAAGYRSSEEERRTEEAILAAAGWPCLPVTAWGGRESFESVRQRLSTQSSAEARLAGLWSRGHRAPRAPLAESPSSAMTSRLLPRVNCKKDDPPGFFQGPPSCRAAPASESDDRGTTLGLRRQALQ